MPKSRQRWPSYYFGFKIRSNPIFLYWHVFELLCWVSQSFRYFVEPDKFLDIFLSLPIFVPHT